jgi:hypothetical protein
MSIKTATETGPLGLCGVWKVQRISATRTDPNLHSHNRRRTRTRHPENPKHIPGRPNRHHRHNRRSHHSRHNH